MSMSLAEKIISYRESHLPVTEDLTVLHSMVDYDHQNDSLNYILFDILVNPAGSSEPVHLFKAIKLYRLIRVPKNDKIANFLMEKQSEVLASMWENSVHFISLVANLLKPEAIGLVYTYGVQGVGESIAEAKQDADRSFASLTSSLKGVFRTIEFRRYNYKEAEWLRKKMISMKNLSILRGIPYPHQGTNPSSLSKTGNTGGSAKGDIRSQTETMEEFIAGMTDHEYVMVTMANPIHERVLRKWLTVISREESKWSSIMQGSSSVNFSLSTPFLFGGNMGSSLGYSHGSSHNIGVAHGQVSSWSDGTSQGFAHGFQQGHALGISQGQSHGVGTSHTVSDGTGTSHTVTNTQGSSHSTTHSTSTTSTTSHSVSSGTSGSHSSSTSSSNGGGSSLSWSKGTSSTQTHGTSGSIADGHSHSSSTSRGNSVGGGVSVGLNKDLSEELPVNPSINASYSHNWGASWSSGNSYTTTSGHSSSTSNGQSSGYGGGSNSSWSNGSSNGYSNGWSDGVSNGTSKAMGSSSGYSDTVSSSQSIANGASTSHSVSNGQSTSQSWNNGTSNTNSNGSTQTWSNGTSQSQGGSDSVANSVSNGLSFGTTNGWSLAQTSSMGVAPGISIGKSYQWKDVEAENVVRLLSYQRERLNKALNGQGAFFVDTMIATENDMAHHAGTSIAKASFYNNDAIVSPLQIIEPQYHKKDHLLYHFSCFSPCHELDGIPGEIDSYKYSTVLLCDELTAYTHPPRMSFGGLYADVDDMPEFSVPSDRQFGDMYIGHILSGQTWSEEAYREYGTGYKTPFKFSIFNNELMHAVFQGESRSGKTETAIRAVAEASEMIRETGKKLRIIVFDQKDDWRKLARIVDLKRFRFFKMDDTGTLGLRVNLCKIPPNVHPEIHVKTLAEIFVSAYGLGILGSQILKDSLFKLYKDHDCVGEDWASKAHINSSSVTFSKLYEVVNEEYLALGKNGARNAQEAYQRVLMRLNSYATEGTILNTIFSSEDGIGVHELLGKDDITAIEAKLLDKIEKAFIYGVMFASIYSYGINNGTFLAEDQYETVLVVEEANSVLRGQTGGDSGENVAGQSRFEDIIDQSAGNGMFVFAVTQSIHLMPSSILNSCGIWFVGRSQSPEAHAVILPAIGKNPRWDYKIANFLALAPTGWFIVKTGRIFDFKQSAPTYVLVDPVQVDKKTVRDDKVLLQMKEMREHNERLNGIERYF